MSRALVGVAAMTLCSCGPISFSTTLTGQGTVQGSLLGGVLGAFPSLGNFTSIDFNQNQDFQNNNTEKNRVTSVRVQSLTVKITSPSDQDFGFLDSVQFSAQANGQTSQFAHKSNIAGLGLAAPNPTLTLDLDDVDLATYVKADNVSLVMQGSGRPPSKDTSLEAKVTLLIGAKLF